jgi:hypothetical protein
MAKTPTYRSLGLMATFASVLIAARTFLDGIVVFDLIPEWLTYDLYSDDPDISSGTVAVIGIYFAVVLGGVIAFIATFFRANKNLRALGRTDLEYTPGATIYWWFVPIAHFVMPFRVAQELVKASDPASGDDVGGAPSQDGAGSWRVSPVPQLVQVWWGLWIANSLADRVLFAGDEVPGLFVSVLGMILEAGAAAGGILVLRLIAQRQAELAAHRVQAPNLTDELGHVAAPEG